MSLEYPSTAGDTCVTYLVAFPTPVTVSSSVLYEDLLVELQLHVHAAADDVTVFMLHVYITADVSHD